MKGVGLAAALLLAAGGLAAALWRPAGLWPVPVAAVGLALGLALPVRGGLDWLAIEGSESRK